MRNLVLILAVLFSIHNSLAQGIPSDYQKAKAALNSKDYWEAMNGFKQLTDSDKYGNLANYAAFHLAEASLGANQPTQAINALQPVVSKNWNKSDEAKYLLAVAYFRNNQNTEALKVIKTIKSETILEKSYNLTYDYLIKSSASFLVTNLNEYKSNEGFGAALATILQQQTVMSSSELDALNQVRSTKSGRKVPKDDILDIVLILPFTGANPSSSKTEIDYTDFMFELFQGIDFGVEQLKEEGQKVILTTFDSKRNIDHLSNILGDPAVAKADVIIGPIYPEEAEVVSLFAEQKQIPFVHPLSNLGERFERSNYSYLFRPSVASLAGGIVSKMESQNWGKRVAMGYSGSSRDENLGLLLQTQLEKAGFELVKFQKVDSKNVSTFLQNLGVSLGRKSTVDQIILLSDDPAIGQSVFSLMESVSTSVPMLVMDSWLGFNFANYEMMKEPNFNFIANNTPKFATEAMSDFRKQFFNRYYVFPGLNSILGMELVYWLETNVKPTFDYDLRRSLDRNSFQPGKLTWGFNFQNANHNSYTPIFKLEAGELVPLK